MTDRDLRLGPYGRLYASAAFQPKHIAAGDSDGYYWRADAWSVEYSDDGFVPNAIVEAICGVRGKHHRTRLVAVGLWIEVEGGICIHDWSDHNVTRKERERKRELANDRKRRQRSAGRHADHPRSVTRDTTVTSRSGNADGTRLEVDGEVEVDALRATRARGRASLRQTGSARCRGR